MMTDDEQQLHAYARERSEAAFGELVARHIDFVYSAALRVVNGDSHLAQDVAQTVFIELAREGESLPDDVALPGWLHRHTCYTATKAVRTERRRQSREQTAMEMRALDDNTSFEWGFAEKVSHFSRGGCLLMERMNYGRLAAPQELRRQQLRRGVRCAG